MIPANNASIAQLAERETVNLKVVGSTPTWSGKVFHI